MLVILGTLLGFGKNAGFECRDVTLVTVIQRLWYSVDKLIPFLKLDRRHDKISPTGLLRSYFHLHQILGFLLMSLIVAGLTGVTK